MKTDPVSEVSLSKIVEARLRLNGAIVRTPCTESAALSELTGSRIFCKQEHLQRTGSFKERGARNALALLTPEQARLGAIAASAGNHALGLAWHGRSLGIPVTVVMPRFAPLVKVARCRQFGATVVLHGDTFDEARNEAGRLAEGRALTYIHPFDDAQVIAGQGTLAFEILEQVPDAEAIIIPVGGGGLLAGVATVFQALKPSLEIIGVEPENAACFAAGLAADAPVRIMTRFTLADGLAVAEAGRNTLAMVAPLEYRMVSVARGGLGSGDVATGGTGKVRDRGSGCRRVSSVAGRKSARA